jgi:hypothetical protein
MIASLRADFEAERYQAVVIDYRTFLHHAVNAVMRLAGLECESCSRIVTLVES